MKYTVIFFEKANGEFPALDFIRQLHTKLRAKALGSLEVLENAGCMAREPYSKLLDDGIFELRVHHGTDTIRLLYFFGIGKRSL